MTSMNTNMDGHSDEQPPAKKQRIDDSIGGQQQGSEQPTANCMNTDDDEQKEELETSTTTTVDLPRPRHRKLPAELNQQIFLCFNPATQLKFIGGLGWDFYAMFRYRLLTKTKRVRNPQHGNRWNGTDTRATIAADGQNVKVSNQIGAANVFAEQSFPISGPLSRMDDFPGTICYYYEVKGRPSIVGLSGAMIYNLAIGGYSNSYAIPIIGHLHHCLGCRLDGEPEPHFFELPEGAIWPVKKGYSDVFGCGLVLDPDNKLSIFFTLNGQLLGRKISISPTVDRLFPAFTMVANESIEANFGDDPAKPFEYDIQNCPGFQLACI